MTVTAYVALGSNLGDRHSLLEKAVQSLRIITRTEVTRVSAFHETAPVGGPPGQGNYLNAVAEVRTELAPRPLLDQLLAIEQEFGRVRQVRFGPRTLDLDLALYGTEIISEPGLAVPHPRLHERRFVLEPLAEIAPHAVHPVFGSTVRDLLHRLERTARPARELRGKRAVVTGSTSGIGRSIALNLAAAGADVIVHGRRPDRAQAVACEVVNHDVRAKALIADLHDQPQRDTLVETAWATWDGIDIWVNNAGADTLTGEAANWPFDKKLAELWAVDVAATIALSRAIGQRLREAGGGAILNMGWDQAEVGMEGDSGQLFASTKAAVMAFSKSLALSLAPAVRVNCLAPGWIKTAWGDSASNVWQTRVLNETPLGRWGTPEDVAAAARWLVSPAASFITGQVIRINGGAVR